ncbi:MULTISPECIES: PspA/IM30 family protein [Sphingobacterium]|uniref:PspA/IM30 family protein n=1 Tax=Sphingobacterium TaxID=28453 RepID=UPI00200EE20A|nr:MULTISPECIES: PspA/IM30 family protein [Sphingobacterium]UPZ37316.1 PspA/IM30 family protein [Sphingobacterium sp. PCS056]UXD68834.1 PspA/IM30 family protein [Sphingobacterium faecium]WGQ16547.1 PspA/IM30 family protein [Sphingobacterium faecium]
MMNIFKRIFRIGQAEIHAVVEKMEDPIKMTEQGIREMKDDLEQALEAYAKVKALAIRTKSNFEKKQEESTVFEGKAILLLKKAQNGELSIDKAENLAKEALVLKNQFIAEATELEKQSIIHLQSADELHKNVDILKFNISKWESELATLKARVKVSNAAKMVNKQLANIDSNSTISMLERMKVKVEEDEALAKAYGEIAHANKSIIDEINETISNKDSVNDELQALKLKLKNDEKI